MKTPFLKRISWKRARDAQGALVSCGLTEREPKVIEADADELRKLVLKKLTRCLSNLELYSDKRDEYQAVIDKFDKSAKTPIDIAQAMLEHGDSRIDNPRFVGVIAVQGVEWLVFGYTF